MNDRYLFQGHVVAAAAHIREPSGLNLMQGSIALPVTGGFGQIQVVPQQWPIPETPRGITFESAAAFVSGDFIGPTQSQGPARTVAAAYLNNLNVLNRLVVNRLAAHLVLDVPHVDAPQFLFGSHDPITGAPETWPITGFSIDGCPVNIELDLLRLESRAVRTSIVKSLTWGRGRIPNATIDRHTITVENLGRIYVGELWIEGRSRQLTLLRLELGSPVRGVCSFGDVRCAYGLGGDDPTEPKG